MTSEYGMRVAGALQAVRQLHTDTSRFLVDFHNNRVRDGWTSVFGNTVTRDQTAAVPTFYWMAEGVYRYYTKASVPNTVEGVSVAFFHEQEKFKEPLLLVGQIQYKLPTDTPTKEVCKAWDLWNVCFEWDHSQNLEKIISLTSADSSRVEWASGRIESAKAIGVPLYSIKRVADAEELMARVRKVSDALVVAR